MEIFHVETNHVQHERMAGAGVEEVPEFSEIDCSYKNCESDDVVKAIEEEIREVKAKLLTMIPQKYRF